MYIDHIARRPSIREANRIETVQAKNVNIKKLRMMDKQIAQDFVNGKYHGGRLYMGRGFGSWLKKSFKKIGNFAKKAFNKVIKPAYQKVIKPGLNFLTKNEIGKSITSGASKIIGSAVSAIPVVGPIAGPVVSNTLPSVLESVNNITDAAESVVQGIKDKNPQVSINQAKEIVGTIKKTYNTLSDEAKKAKAEQMKKVEQKLPETIKAEGFEAVMKAAPFLPIVDLSTLREEQTPGRGGKLKTTYKIRKPKGADQLGKYSAPIVARVAGRMFLSGEVPGLIADVKEEVKESKAGACGRHKTQLHSAAGGNVIEVVGQNVIAPKPATAAARLGESKTDKNMALLEQLRKKYV